MHERKKQTIQIIDETENVINLNLWNNYIDSFKTDERIIKGVNLKINEFQNIKTVDTTYNSHFQYDLKEDNDCNSISAWYDQSFSILESFTILNENYEKKELNKITENDCNNSKKYETLIIIKKIIDYQFYNACGLCKKKIEQTECNVCINSNGLPKTSKIIDQMYLKIKITDIVKIENNLNEHMITIFSNEIKKIINMDIEIIKENEENNSDEFEKIIYNLENKQYKMKYICKKNEFNSKIEFNVLHLEKL